MADVNITYKGASIATMDASGTKTLTTHGKYCEGDISVSYTKPSGKEALSWHQCPEAVRNYLAYVAEHPYSTSDWAASYIADYAPSSPLESNTKPVGFAVDGVTFADNEPLVATPFATQNKAGTLTALDRLRWYNTHTANARDLGGWACDGGSVRYGILVRGALPNKTHTAEDKALMVDKIGIKSELQLYGGSDSQYSYEEGVSPWGIDWYGEKGYIWYTLGKRDLWTYILGVIFDSVLHSKPVYFHCGAGKDRTGTIAVMLLALLGVSQSDIDQDYELTTFATGSGNGITSRTGTDYKNFINAIHAYPLANGLSDTLQNHAASFVLSLGFSADTLNSFRAACIDGTPSIIEPTLEVYTIAKSGDHVTYDNDIASITEKQAYSVRATADVGYVISSVSVTMGGTDITSQVFSGTSATRRVRVTNNLSYCSSSNNTNVVEEGTAYTATITASAGYTLNGATVSITMGGTDITATAYNNGAISIASVTGNVVITIAAVEEQIEIINLANPSSPEWMDGYRIRGTAAIVAKSGSQVTNLIPVAVGDVIRIKGAGEMNDYIVATFPDASATQGVALQYNTTYDEATGVKTITVTGADYPYVRFAFVTANLPGTVDDIIITRNQPIT